ncbi:MAG: hypothetical protein KAK01_10010, partial [Candidatus Marinimicrobia bacterium]|nr:hypothetical protein [Candidatus Neomarinimicrobiota bacterium]
MLNKTTLLISIILISIANSTTWYISTSGNDNNNGTSDYDAFATIQHGIDMSTNGDTVFVEEGTYYENINFNGKNIVVGSLLLTTGDTSYISQTIIDGN